MKNILVLWEEFCVKSCFELERIMVRMNERKILEDRIYTALASV